MSYLKDREIWLSNVPTDNPPAGYVWVFIQNGVFVVRDSNGLDKIMATTTGTVTNATSASYVEYSNVASKPALISGSSQVSYTGLSNIPVGIVSGSAQVTYSGLTGIPSGIVSGSAQVASFGIFATTGSNGFNGSQSITGSLTVTGLVGIGIVPSVWDTSVFPDVLQVGNGSVSNNGGAFTQFANNIYYSGSSYRYISTGGAQRLVYDTDGAIVFENAASGTGGNAFTFSERLRVTSGGHVGIKIVPNSGWGSAMAALQIGTGGVLDNWTGSDSSMSVGVNYYDNGSGAQIRLYAKGASKIGFDQNIISLSNAISSTAGSTITWAERMSINGDGNLRINNLGTGAVYSNSGTLTNAAPLITATGGTIVTTDGFKYHTFTSSGTFQVTAGSGLIEVFVLGGGGAGGGDASGVTFYAGGGGSGGGLYHPAYYVEVGSYTVTVGAGGTPNALSNAFGGDGNNSVFGNITALGGGGGSKGNADSANSNLGRNGGSGGGGGSANGVGGISTQSITNGVAYGNNGANGTSTGGGGGGIGTQPSTDGFGGFGKYILNQANRIGGGGGTGTFANGGNNGRDGGGRGGYWNGSDSSNSSGTAGTANTGGGGGGLGYNVGLGGAGGSGIVIVKYKV